MTEPDTLHKATIAALREQADFLKHNIATWQLLARAADEMERQRVEIDRLRQLQSQPRPSWRFWY